MKRKILLAILPALLSLTSCGVKPVEKETFNFVEDTTLHEEVFSGSQKPVLKSYKPVDPSQPALGIQTQEKTVEGVNYISVRFVAAVNIAESALSTTKVAWHRAMFKDDGSCLVNYEEKECHVGYTSITDGTSVLNINSFAGGAYTYFFVYSVLNIRKTEYCHYRLNAYLSVGEETTKVVSTTVDQSNQFSFDYSWMYFLQGTINGEKGVWPADYPTNGEGNKASFSLDLKSGDEFIIFKHDKDNARFDYINYSCLNYDDNSSIMTYFEGHNGCIKAKTTGNYILYLNYNDELWTNAFVPTYTDFYVRGAAANGWGDNDLTDDYRFVTDRNNVGVLLNVELNTGEFKIADEGWDNEWAYWGYKRDWYEDYDYHGGNTKNVIGGASDVFTEGSGDSGPKNINCSKKAKYNIYITNNGYISIEYAAVEPTEDLLVFEDIDDTQTRVVGLQGGYLNKTNIVIPATHNGKTVSEIGEYAFSGDEENDYMNPFLKTVQMPDTIGTIGAHAFDGCWVLESVNISSNLRTIHSKAFYGAGSYSRNDGLAMGKLPASLVNVADDAFEQCYVQAFDIDSNNPKYYSRDGMFMAYKYSEYNNALLFYPPLRQGNLIIDDDIEYVGRCGLNSPYAESVHFGSGLKKCRADAFYLCANCQSFTADANNAVYSASNGVLYDKAGDILIAYPRAKTDESLTIPSGVTAIEEYAFFDNDHIKTVNLNGVKSIGYSAFDGCGNLTTIDLSKIITLSRYAFAFCEKLASPLTFASGLYIIPDDAFTNCSKIPSVVLPDTCKEVHSRAFKNCTSLASVTFSRDFEKIEANAFEGCSALNQLIYDEDNTAFITIESEAFKNALCGAVIIPDTVTTIGEYAFFGSNMTSIAFPSNSAYKEIAYRTCMKCFELTSVMIPGTIETIGEDAFSLGDGLVMGKLDNVYIGDGVKVIAKEAFRYQHFNKIFIPKTVTSIGVAALAVNNGSLLSNNTLDVTTDAHNENGMANYYPEGWHLDTAIGSGVTWTITCDQTRS